MLGYTFSEEHAPKVKDFTIIDVHDEPNWIFPYHSHEGEDELTLVLRGNMDLIIVNDFYKVKQGDIIIKRTGMVHKQWLSEGDSLRFLSIHLEGVDLKGNILDNLVNDRKKSVIPAGQNFSLLTGLFEYIASQQDHDKIPVSMINTILYLIVDSASANGFRIPQKALKSQTIENVVSYIDNNFNEKITLEELGNKFYISPFYLSRKFKDQTGTTINNYIMERRIGEAQQQLIFSDADILTISENCGFSDIHYFYKCFKKYNSVTPVQYRDEFRLNNK